MAVLYDALCARFSWAADEALRARLRAENAAALAAMDAVIADARVQHGDVEVGAAVLKKAQYLGASGDVAGALRAYKELPEKSLSTGGKADVAMACARLGFAHGDWACVPAACVPAAAAACRPARSKPTPPPPSLPPAPSRRPPPAAWCRRSSRRQRR